MSTTPNVFGLCDEGLRLYYAWENHPITHIRSVITIGLWEAVIMHAAICPFCGSTKNTMNRSIKNTVNH